MTPDPNLPPAPSRTRRLILAALLVASLVTLGIGGWQLGAARQRLSIQGRPALSGEAPAAAIDFRLETLDGATLGLSDLRGKVVLLNFWATWCPPCEAEMPDLDTLHLQYGAEHEFAVVAIDLMEDRTKVAAFAEKLDIHFPILLDFDGAVTNDAYLIRAFPTSFIIDREGRIRDTWQGQIAREAMVARLSRVW